MTRSSVRVRPATLSDLPSLMDFAEELLDPRSLRVGIRAPLPERVADVLADLERRLVVAVDDQDQPLGMALLWLGPSGALLDVPAVHLSSTVVPDRHRRRGAGRALLASAVAYADEVGAERVVVTVASGARDANRFYARLGLAPVAVRRIAPVSVLRRNLAGEAAAPDTVRRRSLRQLAAGRRTRESPVLPNG
ncbi:MAG: GNAT family N-acetyltransferase [Actinomycetota bacterium]|nr:GNAT family N-acetyltransferase [Actinomycetota bacterium]